VPSCSPEDAHDLHDLNTRLVFWIISLQCTKVIWNFVLFSGHDRPSDATIALQIVHTNKAGMQIREFIIPLCRLSCFKIVDKKLEGIILKTTLTH
jgi:hypothetical protein